MDDEMLINYVHNRNILWDRRNAGHHNRYIRDQNWKEVAKLTGVDRKCGMLETLLKVIEHLYIMLLVSQGIQYKQSGNNITPN